MGFQNNNIRKRKLLLPGEEVKFEGARVIDEAFHTTEVDGKTVTYNLVEYLEPTEHKDIREMTVEDLDIRFPAWTSRMKDRNGNMLRPVELHLCMGADKNGNTQYFTTIAYVKQVSVPDMVQVPDPQDPKKLITKSTEIPKIVTNGVDFEAQDRVPATAPGSARTPTEEPKG